MCDFSMVDQTRELELAFGRFEVHAGDFKSGNYHQLLRSPLHYFGGKYAELRLVMDVGKVFGRETIPISQVREVEIASEEIFNRLGGALAWGVAGDIVFGPVGLLAGLLRGGRGREVTFVCVLNDGRKFLATASGDIFSKIRLATAKKEFRKLA